MSIVTQTTARFYTIRNIRVRSRFFDEVGHQSTEQFGAVFTEAGFAINPMAFMRGFASATVDAGAKLHSFSRVKKWERNGSHKLITDGGSITANKVVVATNGYTDESLHPSFANLLFEIFVVVPFRFWLLFNGAKLLKLQTLQSSTIFQLIIHLGGVLCFTLFCHV